jgi:hypothetical protein
MALCMSDKPYDDPEKSSDRVVKHNEKFNVPLQTEEEEAETHENAQVENLANDKEIKHKKQE